MICMAGLFLGRSATAAATGNGLLRAFAGSGIRPGSLSSAGQISAMAHSPIAANFYQPLDVHLNFAAEITFDLECLGNIIAQEGYIVLAQVFHPNIRIDPGLFDDVSGSRGANPIDVLQPNFNPFVAW